MGTISRKRVLGIGIVALILVLCIVATVFIVRECELNDIQKEALLTLEENQGNYDEQNYCS